MSTAEGKPNGRALGSGNLPWASIPSLAGWHLTLRSHAPAHAPPPARGLSQRKLLPTIGPVPGTATAELAGRLAAYFGRKSQKRSTQISAILDTLKALGHIA